MLSIERRSSFLVRAVCAAAEARTLKDLTLEALPALARAFDAPLATCLEVPDAAGAPQVLEHIPPGMPDPFPQYWQNEYFATDPLQEVKRRLNPRVAIVSALVDRDVYRSSAVYNELCRPMELEQLLAARLTAGTYMTRGMARLALFRSERQQQWSEIDLRMFGTVLPVFESIARRQASVAAQSAAQEFLEDALQRADAAALAAFDRVGRLLWLSPGAEELLRPGAGRGAAFPEALLAAVRTLGRLTGREARLQPVALSLQVPGPEAVAWQAELYLGRRRSTGEPYVLVRLQPPDPDGAGATDRPSPQELARRHGLTRREGEVLHGLGLGHSNPEIAERLFISSETVRTHLQRVYRKLGVASRLQAVLKAAGPGGA